MERQCIGLRTPEVNTHCYETEGASTSRDVQKLARQELCNQGSKNKGQSTGVGGLRGGEWGQGRK